MSIIEINNLNKNYGNFQALKNVNLKIEEGKITGLLGPNGSGKTTLIKIINGLLKDYTGEVVIDGFDIGVETKKIISYLPENTYLSNWMTVRDAVNLFADFYEDFDRNKAEEMLKIMNVGINLKVKQLSKGMYEKVQLMLVMSRKAKLYILDEPIGGVDPAAREIIIETILKNYAEDGAILLSTHLVSDVERIFDNVIFLKQGEIYLQDDVDNLRSQHNKSIDELFREVFKSDW